MWRVRPTVPSVIGHMPPSLSIRELGGFQPLDGLELSSLPPTWQQKLTENNDNSAVNFSAAVSPRHAALNHLPVESFQLRFKNGRLECNPGMFVGHVALGPNCILHIQPKLRRGSDKAIFCIHTLDALHAQLIQYSRERRRALRLSQPRAFASSQSPILFLSLANMLCTSVKKLVSTGIAHQTKREKLVGPCVRGAFDLRAQLNRRPHTVVARFYAPVHSQRLVRIADTEPNRRIKAALRNLRQHPHLPAETRSRAAALMGFFAGASEHVSSARPSAYQDAPAHYRDALELSDMVLRSTSQGGPGSELRGFELLQPGWVMWEETLRAAIDVQLRRLPGNLLQPSKAGSLVFGDRSTGDSNGVVRYSNPKRKTRKIGKIYPDLLLVDKKELVHGRRERDEIDGECILCGDCKYYEACACARSVTPHFLLTISPRVVQTLSRTWTSCFGTSTPCARRLRAMASSCMPAYLRGSMGWFSWSRAFGLAWSRG